MVKPPSPPAARAWGRWLRHLATGPLHQRLAFGPRVLDAIEQAVAKAERLQASQICVVIEHALSVDALRRGQTARQRAEDVFAQHRLWNTPQRDCVLIYLLLADRDVEILADTGLAEIPAAVWQDCCTAMETHFRARRFEEGAIAGIEQVSTVLAARAGTPRLDQLSPGGFADRPKLI